MKNDKDPLSIELGTNREAEVHGRHRPKKVHRKYIINILLVLLITAGVMYFNLKDNLDEVTRPWSTSITDSSSSRSGYSYRLS
jgi:hypothetical protein